MDKYKELSVTADIAVTLPAHVWISFIAAYGATRWASPDASTVAYEALKQMLNPIYLKEQEAEHQQMHEIEQSLFRMINPKGLSPDDPRNDV